MRKKYDAPKMKSMRQSARSMASFQNETCPISSSVPMYATAFAALARYAAVLPTANAATVALARYQMNHGLLTPPEA
jgi:hypothetical protein